MAIQQISVFLENRPGMLAEMTGVLADKNMDMRALSLAETKDFGIARMIVQNTYETSNLLKAEGFINSLTPVIGVMIPDVPGGLHKVLQVFSDEKINIEYMYAFQGREAGKAYMIFRIGKDMEKAAEAALSKRGMKLLTQEDISEW